MGDTNYIMVVVGVFVVIPLLLFYTARFMLRGRIGGPNDGALGAFEIVILLTWVVVLVGLFYAASAGEKWAEGLVIVIVSVSVLSGIREYIKRKRAHE